ncbi:sensor histidine kinase [Mangrovihabitans endophyticus]|uniref:histidine kinase n=1 Tax=Mangrovihabitans endophyticus TaxID=1751298 RepID=A0A8J3BWQ0_9ACTN|nr:HAMP domain-containing sensor histidine kinase [Mangrovihabitans endophyticus]GGK78115.1 two-component sensor histidine kinase [Mangrovihabitans endophyticus]
MRSLLERLLRRRGVRVRSALAAGAVVAVASVLAGAALLLTARIILRDNATVAATNRADQIASAVRAGAGDAPIGPDRTVVQILDASGHVLAASSTLSPTEPISGLRPAPGVHEQETKELRTGWDVAYRIVAVGVNSPDGPRVVLAAASLDIVDDATGAMLGAMLLGMPVLALVVAAATFHFVGRSLQPVEAMRRQAATITARNLHTRLPVPVAEDEVAALATTMNTMLDRIETSAAAQRRFVADASHELRSPLATIHANADLLAATGLPGEPARSVERIRGESGRMARLVEDLLLLARVDHPDAMIRDADVDLDDLVYAARERITVERPDLAVRGTVRPVRVTGDPDRLHRVLRNLVDNAVRHARSSVTISLSGDAGRAEIVVGDDGPGIPAADRERIFDRFVRLDDSRSRDGGGTGLGLAIARDIVVAHGGTLSVGEDTSGTEMIICLPAKY